jgi:hypothetical protein
MIADIFGELLVDAIDAVTNTARLVPVGSRAVVLAGRAVNRGIRKWTHKSKAF